MSDAWARPESMAASLAPTFAPPRPAPPVFVVPAPIRQNTAVRAWSLIVALTRTANIVVACAGLIWLVTSLTTSSVWQLQPESISQAELDGVGRTGLLYLLALGVVALVGEVALLVWIGLARRDPYLNHKLVRGSMVGTVFGLFVPFYGIRVIARTLTDLWQGSDPARAGHGPRTASRAIPPIVAAYCLLAYFPPIVIALAAVRVAGTFGTTDALQGIVLFSMMATGIAVAASICLIIIVTRVTDRLRGRTSAGDDIPVSSVIAQYVRT